MQSAIGKQLNFEEVKKLPDGTQVWIESVYPTRNVFLGIKQDKVITNLEGKTRWAIAEDFKALCTAYEWIPKNKMTPLQSLLSNIKIYQEAGVLEEEFQVFMEEHPNLDSISELDDLMEIEMSYWEP